MKTPPFLILLSFLLTLGASFLAAETVTLQAGTFIPVRLSQNVNGSINKTGDKVHFQVTEDILVKGKTVISKDTWINGKVTYTKGRKMMGDGGRISIIASSLTAVDGQIVRIERDPLSSEGKTRTANLIVNTTVWGVAGLISKGRAAGIFLDTEFELEIAESIDIDTAAEPTPPTPEPVEHIQIEGSFEKDDSTIRFHNGIVGKDFNLKFDLPEKGSQPIEDPESIAIVKVFNHQLPDPIYPIETSYDAKKELHTATFAFWDIIQYCTPQENNIVFRIQLEDGRIATGTTALNRKWRLK
ncbi:hypothetical protein VDG1235_4598 [Verrucomicrobiia bacterium DG1235]|nr:hypothetical protein VDG1235_4598 [Verrucomicrobiae bacterium DG1235]